VAHGEATGGGEGHVLELVGGFEDALAELAERGFIIRSRRD
jgi:hypothetical protein